MKVIHPNKNSWIDISEINRRAAADPAALIESCERGYQAQLEALTRRVAETERPCRVVLLAGPSSSGKTTTAYKLGESFGRRGVHAPVVSLDNFFLGLERYPKLPDGSPDMEAVEALDLPLINETLLELTERGEAWFPVFDFTTSSRAEERRKVTLGREGVLIMEGLHALNPRLVEVLDPEDIFRAYVSTRTKYMDGEREVLTPKDTRFVRRMVRDHNFRGHSPLATMREWSDVLEGEKKYIYPFRDAVDFKIDSALDYEACVFHHYILPMLEELQGHSAYSERVAQIIETLEAFHNIDHHFIPADSLLREFIG